MPKASPKNAAPVLQAPKETMKKIPPAVQKRIDEEASKTTVATSATEKTPANAGSSSGFNKLMIPSAALAAVIGPDPIARTTVVKKLWAYIKTNNLQDQKDKRTILADTKLKDVFGADRCSMFEMNKHIARNLQS